MIKNISIIVLNYNSADLVIDFIKKIYSYKSIEHIVVVDNESTDNSYTKLKKMEDRKIYVISSGKNKGYGYGNNVGYRFAREKFHSKYVIISNPDISFKENTITSLYKVLSRNQRLLIAAPVMVNKYKEKQANTAWKLLSPFKYVLNEGAIIRRVFKLDQYKTPFSSSENNLKYVDCLAGSFLMLKSDPMFEKGIYDERMFLYCEETYLGLKMRKANYKSVLLLNDYFIHLHGQTINKVYSFKSRQDKMIFHNELYLLKKYMNASKMMLAFARIFFSLCLCERYIFRMFNFKNK